MAPKTNCNAIKLASCLAYLQNSRSCHSLKDLEKALPAAASISGMQVKDYLQALQDDNKIRVEKIGSGNWYWSFASDDKIKCEADFSYATKDHEKLTKAVADLRLKLSEISAQQDGEEDTEESREELISRKAILDADVKTLQKDLEAYSDSDPSELERKVKETETLKSQVERVTDDILAIEGWFRKNAIDAVGLVRMEYGEEWDEEEEEFREI